MPKHTEMTRAPRTRRPIVYAMRILDVRPTLDGLDVLVRRFDFGDVGRNGADLGVAQRLLDIAQGD